MQAQQALPPLTHIVVHTSSVVPAPLEEVWEAVRGFSSIAQWSAPIGLERISAELLPGSVESQVGALRHVCLGALGFVEQLEALDDDRRLLKWRVVLHPLNANPFPGSLLNYRAKLRLYDVTVEQKTFMQMECSFETEHQNGEVMRRELKARQEANVRGLLTLMEARSSLRAGLLSAAPPANLVPMPPLGTAAMMPGLSPRAALAGQLAAASASRELSPRSQALRASISAGPSADYLVAPMSSLPSSIAASSLAASSLNSAGWGSSVETASVVRVPGGVSAAYEVPPQQQQAVPQPHASQQPQMPQQPPVLQHAQVPALAASVHDSVATVQSVDFSKALQHAQAQAQAHGMGSQLARLNARLQQQQGVSLAEIPRPAFKSSTAMTAAMASNGRLHQMRSRASDDMLVTQKGRSSEPDSLSGASRVLSL